MASRQFLKYKPGTGNAFVCANAYSTRWGTSHKVDFWRCPQLFYRSLVHLLLPLGWPKANLAFVVSYNLLYQICGWCLASVGINEGSDWTHHGIASVGSATAISLSWLSLPLLGCMLCWYWAFPNVAAHFHCQQTVKKQSMFWEYYISQCSESQCSESTTSQNIESTT